MKISETLRVLRGERGMTQEEVAERVGLTRQAVSSYESGRTQPGVDILQKLADVYQVELTDIIYGRNQGVRLYEGTKTAAAVMAAILLAMQLIGSVCLWVANAFYPLGAGTSGGQQTLVIRAGWINVWTALNGAYGGLFPLCCVAILVLTLCLRRPLAAKCKALCALCYGAASMLVILPWALSDPVYSAAAYLTTPLLCLAGLALLLLLSLLIDRLRARRGRGEGEAGAGAPVPAAALVVLGRAGRAAGFGAFVCPLAPRHSRASAGGGSGLFPERSGVSSVAGHAGSSGSGLEEGESLGVDRRLFPEGRRDRSGLHRLPDDLRGASCPRSTGDRGCAKRPEAGAVPASEHQPLQLRCAEIYVERPGAGGHQRR